MSSKSTEAKTKEGPSLPTWVWLLVGVLLGAVLLAMVRAITYNPEHIHYHANFALYVNGQRDEFGNFTFYEEVAACADEHSANPKSRVHMHGQVNHQVHVHDEAATWGHFFANLGYTLGNEVLKTDQGVFVDGQDGNKLTVILNGEKVQSVANRVVGDTDVLLVSYGNDNDDEITRRFDAIPQDAAEQNYKQDPANCAGDDHVTLWQRIRHGFGL